MIKQLTTVSAFMISAFTFSQVGIETETPQATLDVVGKPTDNSVLDGIIAPRLEGAQLRAKTYTSAQTGALVYVTLADTAPAGQTVDVTKEGYYYFNGTKWIPADGYNIYNANGSLTSNRTLTLSGFPLNFTGTQQRTNWNANGLLSVNNLQTTGGEASAGFIGGNNSNFYIQQFRGGTVQMIANGNNNRLTIGTGYTTLPSDIRFDTSPGGGVTGEPRMYITPIGNVKIGANDVATEKLDVDGIARIRELPLNGAANAHHTISGDNASATQNQTFTATRTLVADANGVVGYITGIPSGNIYTGNGSLTSNRALTLSGRTLDFLGSGQKTSWTAAGAMSIVGLVTTAAGRPTLELIAPDNNGNGINSRLWMLVNHEGNASILATDDTRSLTIGTGASSASTVDKHISFQTTAVGGTGTATMTLTGAGRLGIGIATPGSTLHVVKNSADLTPAIIAGCPTYADNAAASAAGLPVGGLYRKADGTLMVRY